MTHIQEVFISNLRYFRKMKGLTQLAFSEAIELSPNYLNAVEKGKNFPSPEVLQRIVDVLDILPFELFLENQHSIKDKENQNVTKIIQDLRFEINKKIDDFIVNKIDSKSNVL